MIIPKNIAVALDTSSVEARNALIMPCDDYKVGRLNLHTSER